MARAGIARSGRGRGRRALIEQLTANGELGWRVECTAIGHLQFRARVQARAPPPPRAQAAPTALPPILALPFRLSAREHADAVESKVSKAKVVRVPMAVGRHSSRAEKVGTRGAGGHWSSCDPLCRQQHRRLPGQLRKRRVGPCAGTSHQSIVEPCQPAVLVMLAQVAAFFQRKAEAVGGDEGVHRLRGWLTEGVIQVQHLAVGRQRQGWCVCRAGLVQAVGAEPAGAPSTAPAPLLAHCSPPAQTAGAPLKGAPAARGSSAASTPAPASQPPASPRPGTRC